MKGRGGAIAIWAMPEWTLQLSQWGFPYSVTSIYFHLRDQCLFINLKCSSPSQAKLSTTFAILLSIFLRYLTCLLVFVQRSSNSQRSFARGRRCKTQLGKRFESAEDGARTAGGSHSPSPRVSILRQWRQQPTNETPTPRWTGDVFKV